jgi:formamidopyrimidine-DNA glycosylase
MPELPDVEGYRIALAEHLPGTRVRDVQVRDAGVLRNATAEAFRDGLIGSVFRTPRRQGKWLALPTDGPTVLIHNGMTGHPYFTNTGSGDSEGTAIDRDDRLVITTERGQLHYADLRKLRGIWILEGDAAIVAVIGEQGRDALDISAAAFLAALRGRRGALKTVLMNQQVIAGLGNMLSDEICWRARLHPAQVTNTLADDELRGLHRVMRRTLRAAVKRGRIPRAPSWLSSTRDRDAAPCPRCRTGLQRSRIGGRTSIWCPHCQPIPQQPGLAAPTSD